jgi:hypothetical protein
MADARRSPGLIQRYREELQVRHYGSCGFKAGATRARWAAPR